MIDIFCQMVVFYISVGSIQGLFLSPKLSVYFLLFFIVFNNFFIVYIFKFVNFVNINV